jgi:hypothetical protein
MKKVAVLLLMIAILFACTTSFAASPWMEKTTYKEKMFGKLDFGVKNVLGGWTDIIRQPIKYNKDGKSAAEGFAVGVYQAIVNTVGGALHLVTFPITQVDVPLPNNGVQFE